MSAAPHPATLRSIDLQGGFPWSSLPVRVAVCGCDYRAATNRYRLCRYHEGFDDGIEAATSVPGVTK